MDFSRGTSILGSKKTTLNKQTKAKKKKRQKLYNLFALLWFIHTDYTCKVGIAQLVSPLSLTAYFRVFLVSWFSSTHWHDFSFLFFPICILTLLLDIWFFFIFFLLCTFVVQNDIDIKVCTLLKASNQKYM